MTVEDPAPRMALFVSGPYHGTLRAISESNRKHGRLGMPRIVDVSDARATVEMRWYVRHEVATVETDGGALVDVWLYDDVTPASETADRQLADALLRALIRAGQISYTFSPWTDERAYRKPDPDLAELERCTPPRNREWTPEDEGAARLLHQALADWRRS